LRIELIHPPHPEAIADRLDPPLGLLSIAAMLRDMDVVVNDLSGRDLQVGEADIYGITVYAPSLALCARIADLCRQKNPQCRVVVGGAHPTAVKTIWFADAVVCGEGELALREVVRDFPNLKPQYSAPLAHDLDIYPNPSYDLVDLSTYDRTVGGHRSVPLLTSRGCPFRCAFCGLADHHKQMKFRSPKRIFEEIQHLKDAYGILGFNFQDDLFTYDRERLREILRLLKPLNIQFRCHGRVGIDSLDDYFLLKESGCETIAWGVESGSQEMLDRMRKNVTVRQNEEVIAWARKAGITSRAFLLFGFPGESRRTIEETKEFLERTDPDQYFVSNFVPFPGTPVWNDPEEFGVTSIDASFENFLQVDRTGMGGITFDTIFNSRSELKALEIEFREWISRRSRKGNLQEYERNLEAKHRRPV
jgi:anaerobic magnesium-protoporphyrin IX monomethyl ester cyclase